MKTILLAVAYLVFSQTAFANLKDKKAQADQNTALAGEVTSANKVCGTKLAGSIDWASFSAGKLDISKYSLGAGYCNDALDAMEDLCGDAEGKKALQKIKSYTCKFGGKGKRSIKVNGNSVVVMIDVDAANNKDYFKTQLESSL